MKKCICRRNKLKHIKFLKLPKKLCCFLPWIFEIIRLFLSFKNILLTKDKAVIIHSLEMWKEKKTIISTLLSTHIEELQVNTMNFWFWVFCIPNLYWVDVRVLLINELFNWTPKWQEKYYSVKKSNPKHKAF